MLTAVLLNPPTGEGRLSKTRVALAAQVLSYADVSIANLCGVASADSRSLSRVACREADWLAQREILLDQLSKAEGVLLAYGNSLLSGGARKYHRDQIDWLDHYLSTLQVPVYTLAGRTTHASRWNRDTARMFPDLAFEDALRHMLVSWEGKSDANEYAETLTQRPITLLARRNARPTAAVPLMSVLSARVARTFTTATGQEQP
jgi:hypothetical protein